MRILLDCDGVLADFVGGFLKTLRDIDGVPRAHEDVTQYTIEEALDLTPETTASVHAQISQRGWCLGLQPIIGAREGVKALREAGHDLAVVTARRQAGLLAIAQDVKMTAEGSFHREEGEQRQDVEILEQTFREWRPSKPGCEAWDDAVRDLIALALLETPTGGSR